MKKILYLIFISVLVSCSSYTDIREANPKVSLKDLVEAGDSGEKELVDGLDKLLWLRVKKHQEVDDEKAIEAIIAIKKLDPTSALEVLISLLKDPNEEVRYHAAETLGKVRNSKSIPPLIDATKDEDDIVAEAASRSLTELTLIPIHQEQEEDFGKWQQWWKLNSRYFDK